jgi:hypothetical protein
MNKIKNNYNVWIIKKNLENKYYPTHACACV